jgi:RHS repeat-associated protein
VYNSPNTSYHLTDGLGSVRGMVNAMSDVLSTTTYSPYGVPDSPISGFAFTGEQRDPNGLQYHRARYYNAGLGTWASLDPFEGIHERPMSLNGYSWVGGNVVNAIDPSGLCSALQQDSVSGRLDAVRCRVNVDDLRTRFNVHVLWQEDNMSETLSNMCVEAAQAFGVGVQDKLPWTADEVSTIINAFRIFDTAYRGISGFFNNYPAWRQQGADVKFIKLASLPGNATAGLTEYPSRSIALSQDVWSEGLSSDPQRDVQQKSWLALHEFGHILIQDLGIDAFAQDQLAERLTGDFGNLFVSQYSYQGGTGEYLIEAITGTLWNAGHSAISGYDSSAGGRTGFATLEEHLNNPIGQFKKSIQDDPNQQTQFIVNVRLNAGGTLDSESTQRDTVEKWIIREILTS